MTAAIRFVVANLSIILFLAALAVAFLVRRPPDIWQRLLAWILVLSVGAGSIWAGFFHVFFPEIAASFIGWQVSPFQFEIGVADLAIGLVAVAAFWCGHAFKAAVVAYIVLFNLGVAIGHVHQAIIANNFAPGNFGALLLMTLLQIVLLPALLFMARPGRAAAAPGRPSA